MLTTIHIETNRLILRTLTMDDIEEVASGWKVDDGAISLEEAEEKVRWMQCNHLHNAPGHLVHLCLAIIEKDSQEFIGWCGLDHRDRTKGNPVLFYLLKERYWRKGLATEAARALIQYAMDELALNRIDGGAAAENIASKRVMEKIGMRYSGIDEEGGNSFTISREDYFGVSEESRS